MGVKVISRWFLVLIWCYIIYFLSDIPHLKTKLGLLDLILRKIAHIAEYGILYFLVYRSFAVNFKKAGLLSFIFSFLYALSDELHQGFVPGRVCSAKDLILFDLTGILAAVWAVKKWYKK